MARKTVTSELFEPNPLPEILRTPFFAGLKDDGLIAEIVGAVAEPSVYVKERFVFKTDLTLRLMVCGPVELQLGMYKTIC